MARVRVSWYRRVLAMRTPNPEGGYSGSHFQILEAREADIFPAGLKARQRGALR